MALRLGLFIPNLSISYLWHLCEGCIGQCWPSINIWAAAAVTKEMTNMFHSSVNKETPQNMWNVQAYGRYLTITSPYILVQNWTVIQSQVVVRQHHVNLLRPSKNPQQSLAFARSWHVPDGGDVLRVLGLPGFALCLGRKSKILQVCKNSADCSKEG